MTAEDTAGPGSPDGEEGHPAARLPLLGADDVPEGEPNVIRRFEDDAREAPHVYRVLAGAPRLADLFRTVGVTLRENSAVDARLRELAVLTVSRTAGADYEFAHHVPIAQRAGVRPEQIERLDEFEGDPAFDAVERAVMRYARECTTDVDVGDETWAALTASLLSGREALEIVLHVAWYNASARITGPLRVELEDAYRRPTPPPLPAERRSSRC